MTPIHVWWTVWVTYITGFQAKPRQVTVKSNLTEVTVNNLSPAQPYTFSLHAHNTIGTSPASQVN